MIKTTIGLLVTILLFVACNSSPNPAVGKLHLKALTPVDGVVADALRTKGVTWDSGLNGVTYAGAIVDGDYTSATGIQELLKNTWGKSLNAVLFVDLDNLDDRPSLARVLGFSANHDTYGVLYRFDTSGTFKTLNIREFPGAYSQTGDQLPLTTEKRQANAELFAEQVLQELLPSSQAKLALRDGINPSPKNPIPDELPYVNIKLNETFAVYGAGKFMANRQVATCVSYVISCVTTNHFHDAWNDGSTVPVATVDYNESLWLFHDNYNKRYYVIGTPIINTTPTGLDSNFKPQPTYQNEFVVEREDCAKADFTNYWFGFAQVSWTPSWTFSDQTGKPLFDPKTGTGQFTLINSLPQNTNNVKTVDVTSGFSIGFDASKEGPKAEGSYSWETSTSTEVSDWGVVNQAAPGVQSFRWETNSPGLPEAGPNNYSLYQWVSSFDNRFSFNTLNQNILNMAPTYAYQMEESYFPQALLVKFSMGGKVAAGIHTEANGILCLNPYKEKFNWAYALASMDIQPAQREYTLEPYQIIPAGGK
jgi:hypothetical protein